MTYWQTYRPWLIHLLNERIYLSGSGFCPELLKMAVDLKNLMIYNGYRDDTKLAGFIGRKQCEIRMIIPTNRAHKKQIETLNEALEQAQTFKN
jgi:hypothetical protein